MSAIREDLQFSFQIATNIVFGSGSLESVGAHARELGFKRTLLVTDKVMAQSQGVKTALDKLDESGIATIVWDGISAEPTDETLTQGVAIYRAEGCDSLIGFGGGSSMDTAKGIGVLAVVGEDDPTLFQRGGPRTPPGCAPVIAIPTTSGTGSEVTSVSVFTSRRTRHKLPIRHPSLRPKVAIVDPSLTISMPRGVTVSTGVDALSHAVECFTQVREHPFADTLALESIRLIAENLERVVENGSDERARAGMALAATMAGTAFEIGGLQFHAYAQALGAWYHAPHGITCGIALRAGLRRILPTAAPKLARLCPAFGIDTSGLSQSQAAERGVEAVIRLIDAVGVPTVTQATSATRNDIPALVKETMDTSAAPVSQEEATAMWEEIFRQAENR